MARVLQLFTAHQADLFQSAAIPDKSVGTGHFFTVFNDSGDPYAAYGGRMPLSYNGSNMEVRIHWASGSVTTGGCVWQVAFERLDEGGQSVLSAGFASDLSVTANPAGSLGALDYATISFSNAQADGVQAGESFRIRVTRNTTSGSDNMVGSASVLNVGVIEA